MANKDLETADVKEALSLEDFLLKSPIKLEDEVKVSDRIPYLFKIAALDSETFTAMQKQNTKMFKKGRMSFDSLGFNLGLIKECCVTPNFKSVDFVKKAGSLTPEDAIKKLLLPGEIVNLSGYIQELSGFDKDTEELKDEVKNY